ncbi:MAG: type II secretory pathway component PulM [Motiliproteus sp.]|jgi:type II secretory pathway component PulM
MFKRWYLSLNDREKIFATLGGGVTLGLLLAILIWRPLTSHIQQLEGVIDSKTLQLSEMQNTAQLIAIYRQKSTLTEASASLQQRVTRTATALAISLTRLQSGNEQALQLWMDRVEFNALLTLIDQLSQQGVALDTLNLQPLPEIGYSKARLRLVER